MLKLFYKENILYNNFLRYVLNWFVLPNALFIATKLEKKYFFKVKSVEIE